MSTRRKLRSEGACQPINNIFKSTHFKEAMPASVYAKVTKTPMINCERIRDMKLEPGPDHT